MSTVTLEPDHDPSEDLVLIEAEAPCAAPSEAISPVALFASSLAQTYADRRPPDRAGALHWV